MLFFATRRASVAAAACAVLFVLFGASIPAVTALTCGSYSGNYVSCSVYVSAGQSLNAATCSAMISGATGTGNTFLSLYSPSSTLVASNNDYSGCAVGSVLSYVTVTASTTGYYTITGTCSTTCTGTVAYTVTGTASSCGSYYSCQTCLSSSSTCGWCASSSQCMYGGTYSPTSGTCTGSGTYANTYGYSCSSAALAADSCSSHTSCSSCYSSSIYCGWCSSSESCMATSSGTYPSTGSCSSSSFYSYYGSSCPANGGGSGGGGDSSDTTSKLNGVNAIGTGVAMGLAGSIIVPILFYIGVKCCRLSCCIGEGDSGADAGKKDPSSPAAGQEMSKLPTPIVPSTPSSAASAPMYNGASSSTPSHMGMAPPPPYGAGAEGASPNDVKLDLPPNGQPAMMMQPQPGMMMVMAPAAGGQSAGGQSGGGISATGGGTNTTAVQMCDNQCGQPALVLCQNCPAHYCKNCETRLHEPEALQKHVRVPIQAPAPQPQPQMQMQMQPQMMMMQPGMMMQPQPGMMMVGPGGMMMPMNGGGGMSQHPQPLSPNTLQQNMQVPQPGANANQAPGMSVGIGLDGGTDSVTTWEGDKAGAPVPVSPSGAASPSSAAGAGATAKAAPTAKDVMHTLVITWKDWFMWMLGFAFLISALATSYWVWTGGGYSNDIKIDLNGNPHGSGLSSYSSDCGSGALPINRPKFQEAGGAVWAGGSLAAIFSIVGFSMTVYASSKKAQINVNSAPNNRPIEYIIMGAGGLLQFLAGCMIIFTTLAYDNIALSSIDLFNKICFSSSYYTLYKLVYGPAFGLYATAGCCLLITGLMALGTNKILPHAMSFAWTCSILITLILAGALGIVYIWIATGFAYLCYFVEVLRSHTFGYVRNVHSSETAAVFVERIRGVRPTIWMRVVCYHYETRTRIVSDGKGHTRTETYTVRVDTYAETLNWDFDSWTDESGALTGMGTWSATKLSMSKRWTFADQGTKNKYNQDARDFQARNRHRDVHMDFHQGMNINGFKERLLALIDVNNRPCLLDGCTFIALSLLALATWPYRLWLDSMSVRKHFQFIKQVKVNGY